MYVVFDFETTGLDTATCDIIQMSYIAFDSDMKFVRSEQLFFFYRGMSWSEDAYKVHHISLEELAKHEEEFEGNICKMYAILKDSFVITYNGQRYDGPLAINWLERMGIPGLTFKDHMDMMIEYKPIYKKARISLINLCKLLELTPAVITKQMNEWYAGVGRAESHDSAYDTTATAMLFLKALDIGLIGNGTKTETAVVEIPEADILSKGKPMDPDGMIVFTTKGIQYINHNAAKYAEVNVVYDSIIRDCIKTRHIIPDVFNDNGLLEIGTTQSIFRLYPLKVTFEGGYVPEMELTGTGISGILSSVFSEKFKELDHIVEIADDTGMDFVEAVDNCIRG